MIGNFRISLRDEDDRRRLRFLTVTTGADLFGACVVSISSGIVGKAGRTRTVAVRGLGEAAALVRRRLAGRMRVRGRAAGRYRIVELAADREVNVIEFLPARCRLQAVSALA